MSMKRYLLGLPLTALLAAGMNGLPGLHGAAPFAVGSALAQEDQPERRTKRVDALRATVYEDIARAQKLMEEKKTGEAVEKLNKMLGDKINNYEEAIVRQLLAQVALEREQINEGVKQYENILRLERIPEGLVINALYTLAQLYFIQASEAESLPLYQKSIDLMRRWMTYQETPGPIPYTYLSQAYYMMKDYKQSVENMEKAIGLAKEQGLEIKESWYLVLRSAYFELGNLPKVREILEILAINYDKPDYWRQLAAIYGELGEEKKQLAMMEVAYRRGFLDRESHYVNLAQLYMVDNVPIKAAWVLEEGMKKEIVEKTGDNYELLGQAYLNAQEMVKATEPLRKAAQELNDGEIWMRLGQVYVEQEKWDEALTPLQKAAASDDLDTPGYTHLLIGMAYFNKDQFEDAKEAFRAAVKFDETSKAARDWIKYVNSEQKRRAELTEYYGGGQ